METEQIITVAAKLLTWMRADIADEREPTFGGVQAGAALIGLTRGAEPTDAADRACLDFAGAVLELYAAHDHAVTPYAPTPKEAAVEAAASIKKRVEAASVSEIAAITDPVVGR